MLYIPIALFFPVYKTMIYIFLILSIHESGHILCAKLFHYPVTAIHIYPFGLAAQISYIGFGSIGKELLILLAGPCMHLLMPFLFALFHAWGMISLSFLKYLQMLSLSIVIFNLLPVYPLDGGRIMQSFFHMFFRFTCANKATYLISILNLFLILISHAMQGISAFVVLLFLLGEQYMAWQQIKYTTWQFYRFRLLHPRRSFLVMNEKQDLFRGRYNMLRTHMGWMREETWLEEKLAKK